VEAAKYKKKNNSNWDISHESKSEIEIEKEKETTMGWRLCNTPSLLIPRSITVFQLFHGVSIL